MDSSVVLKSLFNVITFNNKTQVFIYDKSNFIKNPLSIYKYVHLDVSSEKATPIERCTHIYKLVM